jgi:hypothetical protein
MKRVISLVLGLMLVIALAGCTTQASSLGKTVTSTVAVSEGSLPTVSQLAVGTFRLESTEQAVTAEQAKELLPLWKAYRSLSGNASSSQAEIQALVKQVQSAMSEEQLSVITALGLDAEDLSVLMQEQGIDTASVQENNSSSSASKTQSTSGGGGAPMGGVEGGAPPDAGGMPGGEMPAGGTSSGAQASGAAPSGAGNAVVSTALLDALVNMLAAKA